MMIIFTTVQRLALICKNETMLFAAPAPKHPASMQDSINGDK